MELRFADTVTAPLHRAVATLEQAHRLDPDNAGTLNELAVARLAVAERTQQLTPMLRALDAIERAAGRDSLRAEILFNRALILQRLYLVASAQRAWERYLAVERDPRWRAEAQAHARWVAQVPDTLSWDAFLAAPPTHLDATMRREIAARVRRSPQKAREFGFPLLAAWGAAVAAGDSARAGQVVDLAREIGTAARALGLDRSVALAVGAIDAAAGDSLRLRKLARGHVALEQGRLTQERGTYVDAIRLLDESEANLRAASSPAAHWAAFYRAASAVNGVDYTSGDRGFRRLLAETTANEPALAGKTVWALGLSQLRRGSYDTANAMYRRARPYIARAGEAENDGALALLLAEGLTLAGQSSAGLAEAYRGLRLLSPHRRSVYLNNHLAVVAGYARSQGLSHAALALTDEGVEVARRLGRARTLALAFSGRARDRALVGWGAAAGADLELALRWAAEIEPGRGGDRIRANVGLALGQLIRARDPRAALPVLAEVVDAYSSFGSDFYLPTALYEAALAARASGENARAKDWLRRAVDFVEMQQTTFASTESRVTFYETVENVFDEMLEMELESGRPDSAFQVLERGRVHAWASTTRQREARVARVHMNELRATIPADMLLVEYALLRDKVVIWTVSQTGSRQYTVPVSRATVRDLADRLAQESSARGFAGPDYATRLFDLLLRPLAAELAEVRQLTIVPDRELYRVPFAALRDRATGRYVVEEYRVRTVPSAGFFLAASSTPRPVQTRGSALVIGNPRLNSSHAGPLPPLPGADREAAQVAGLYPGVTRLHGGDASRGQLLRQFSRHSIIHFAGHAVFNPEQPELSYLALAPDGHGDGGMLRAWEIGGLRLSNVQVVVLSACSSLSPRASRTGAVAGLAYSFLRAGAPATVSTLWDVEDGASAELLVRFHHHLTAGAPAAEALRLAQVEALSAPREEPRAPRTWAAFVYTGP